MHCGWDLVVPRNWAMAFWLPLFHSGARAVGQNELSYLMYESGVLHFPNEFSDTVSGQVANRTETNNSHAVYMRRPPSKRVNYFKLGFLTPFSCPWASLLCLNSAAALLNSEEKEQKKYFIMRNKKVLFSFSNAFFNKNKQLKAYSVSLSEREIEVASQSYTAVRLVTVGRGTIDKFSLLYAAEKREHRIDEDTNANETMVVNSLVKNYRAQVLAKLETSDKKVNINKLLKSRFNKHDLLKEEKAFYKFNLDLIDSKEHRVPVGFVCNSGFTLVTGGCSANAFVLTKYLIETILRQNTAHSSQRTKLLYKTPNSYLYRSARIVHFFI